MFSDWSISGYKTQLCNKLQLISSCLGYRSRKKSIGRHWKPIGILGAFCVSAHTIKKTDKSPTRHRFTARTRQTLYEINLLSAYTIYLSVCQFCQIFLCNYYFKIILADLLQVCPTLKKQRLNLGACNDQFGCYSLGTILKSFTWQQNLL